MISEEQSAFVLGRLITDNVIVAFEMVYYIKRTQRKHGTIALKTDESEGL